MASRVIELKSADMDAPQLLDCAQASICYYTHRAPDKDSANEDSAAVFCDDDGNAVLLVADGLGGHQYGDRASACIVDEIATALKRPQDWNRESILDAIERADASIQQHHSGAASTVALGLIENATLRPVFAGDSSILLTGQRGRIKYQSTPHSPVGYAVEAGVIEEADAMFHDERHLVSNAVGCTPMHIELGSTLAMAQFDTLLIGSDGVFDNLMIDEIVDIIRKGDLLLAANRLQQLCAQRMIAAEQDLPSKPDDTSFILYRRR